MCCAVGATIEVRRELRIAKDRARLGNRRADVRSSVSGSDAGRHGGHVEMPHHLVKAQSAAKQRNVGRGGGVVGIPSLDPQLDHIYRPTFRGSCPQKWRVVDVSSHPFLHMCQKGDTNR